MLLNVWRSCYNDSNKTNISSNVAVGRHPRVGQFVLNRVTEGPCYVAVLFDNPEIAAVSPELIPYKFLEDPYTGNLLACFA